MQFVGFLAAYRQPGRLPSMVADILGSIITKWVTFVPCFFWIFLGAPHVERLRGNQRWSCALSAIMATVDGVITYLAVSFARHTLFEQSQHLEVGSLNVSLPVWGTVRVAALLWTVLAAVLLWAGRWKLPWVVLECCGIAWCLGQGALLPNLDKSPGVPYP